LGKQRFSPRGRKPLCIQVLRMYGPEAHELD
jgi:hypothetical protein